MKTVAINIDGVIRDFISRFDFVYRKHFIHNPHQVDGNIPTHADVVSGNIDENAFQVKDELTEEELEKLEQEIQKKEKELLNLPVDTDDLTIHYKFSPSKINVLSFDDDKGSDKPIRLTSKEVMDKFIFEEFPFSIFGKASEYSGAMEQVNRIQAEGRESQDYETILISDCKNLSIPPTFYFLSTYNCRIKTVKFVNSDEEKWNHCDILIDSSPKAIHSKPTDKEIIKINQTWNKWDKTRYSFDDLKSLRESGILTKITKTK